jgi:Fic family protein
VPQDIYNLGCLSDLRQNDNQEVRMTISKSLDFKEAVEYHYGAFPPSLDSDYGRLIIPLVKATSALARYDQMLKGMHNSELFLTPMRSQEAVVSSRIEGTISTLDEVLRLEAEQEDEGNEPVETEVRADTFEVFLYGRAMKLAQDSMKSGQPLSPFLIRSLHKVLLGFGRGAHLSPGEFKSEQNYLADRNRRKILFVPIRPENLLEGLDRLFSYINDPQEETLIKTAVTHLEFEALHPFKDGNGRIGRMMIPLLLWKAGLISEPYFYVSGYFEEHKDEYIDGMRNVSENNAWADWIIFFLEALESQAQRNLAKVEEIGELYNSMKIEFSKILSSKWNMSALDFIFTRPVFRNNVFTSRSGIPAPTAYKFIRALLDAGILRTVQAASGRRPALYAFEPLLTLIRE